MTDNDLQDLTSLISVVSQALNYDAVTKVTSGSIEIIPEQSNKEE
jgi:hypothetical protein